MRLGPGPFAEGLDLGLMRIGEATSVAQKCLSHRGPALRYERPPSRMQMCSKIHATPLAYGIVVESVCFAALQTNR